MSCAGGGPDSTPSSWKCVPSWWTGPSAAQIARMTSTASASASTLCPAVSRGRPSATSASWYVPAPIPSSTRPPLRMSRLAALRASTTGGRSGRLATLGATRTLVVAAATTDSSVQVSRKADWYGWSWKLTMSSPATSASRDSSTTASAWRATGTMKAPNWRSWR